MNLILVDTIDIRLKTRYEKISTCLNSNGNVSFLIMPRIAWVKMDLETTYYSHKYQQSALAVCQDIIGLPQLRPALISSQIATVLRDAVKSIIRFSEIPAEIKSVVPEIFSSLQFVTEPVPSSVYSNYAYSQFPPASSLLIAMGDGTLPSLGVDLRRIRRIGTNKLDQGEMSTINKLTGQKMQIFHTCLLLEIGKSSKPYSILESSTLKLKGWMSI